MSVRGIRGKRPAGAPELGCDDGVTAERTPRAREGFSDAVRDVRVRHQRQRKGVIARSLIDAAGESLIAALKNPAKKSTWFAVGARSSHADESYQ